MYIRVYNKLIRIKATPKTNFYIQISTLELENMIAYFMTLYNNFSTVRFRDHVLVSVGVYFLLL